MNEFVRMYVSPINISANDTTPILMVRVQKKVPKVRRKNVIMTNIKMPHMNYCIHFSRAFQIYKFSKFQNVFFLFGKILFSPVYLLLGASLFYFFFQRFSPFPFFVCKKLLYYVLRRQKWYIRFWQHF